ncbi:RodZ family helix-turn-helix domain-containing protein [Tuwongella immobilis]|uniref:Uncharacterized protein n=1 Tax=Tuwongella immobilis TaxID=692036 RepID=A0A6C2YN56_9BACT|nr:hypothetical protein [Tuwongella immobilis]VIP02814.1 unnamed protein product [Tuwongella immobilis]VTS02530.1 unnamed protein product [Tuwongella immobilis]
MRNLLALVGLVVVVFGGLGSYLGWYKVTRQPSTDGEVHLGVKVDTSKIKQDAHNAIERGGEIIQDIRKGKAERDAANADGTTAPAPVEPTPAPTNANNKPTPPVSLPTPFANFRNRRENAAPTSASEPVPTGATRNGGVPSDPGYRRP